MQRGAGNAVEILSPGWYHQTSKPMNHRETLVKPFLVKLLTPHKVFAGLKLRTTPKHPLANATRLIRALGKTHPSVRVRCVLTRAPETGTIKHPQPPSQQGAPSRRQVFKSSPSTGEIADSSRAENEKAKCCSWSFLP